MTLFLGLIWEESLQQPLRCTSCTVLSGRGNKRGGGRMTASALTLAARWETLEFAELGDLLAVVVKEVTPAPPAVPRRPPSGARLFLRPAATVHGCEGAERGTRRTPAGEGAFNYWSPADQQVWRPNVGRTGVKGDPMTAKIISSAVFCCCCCSHGVSMRGSDFQHWHCFAFRHLSGHGWNWLRLGLKLLPRWHLSFST